MPLSKQVSEFVNTKVFVAGAEFRCNAMIPWMFLESFDCQSRSNRPCAAKVQNNVCWIIGKIQWSCRHPSSVSSRAFPSCSLSPRNIRPLTRRPVIIFGGICNLLLDVLQRLKVPIEDELLPCLFPFWVLPCLCSGNNPFVGLLRAKTTLLQTVIAFLTIPSCHSFLWVSETL